MMDTGKTRMLGQNASSAEVPQVLSGSAGLSDYD
jgi:hypothetical protein